MRQTAKLMYGLAAFLVVLTVLYFFATSKLNDNGNGQGIELAGGTGLVLATLLCLFPRWLLPPDQRQGRHQAEGLEQAEIEDGAGVLGFFSASSGWPFLMAFAIMLMGYGIAFFHIWLILLGA